MNWKPLVLLTFAAAFSSCASMGPKSLNPALVMTPGAQGAATFQLWGGPLQDAVLTGDARADGDGWILMIRELKWFNNWENGWTEASFLLENEARLQQAPAGWTITAAAPSLDAPGAATIRYFNSYVRGDPGITEFSRRWARIQAVCGYLQTQSVPQSRMKRYLFPEVYGYESPQDGKATVPALGIDWNTAYTKARFPEPLRPLRDTGTLYRDYKESPELWALAWSWKVLWDSPIPVSLEWKKP